MSDPGRRRGRARGFLSDSPLIVVMWVLIIGYLIWALVGGPLPG